MLSESTFRRAILDKPDSNEPRLAFADWLDEHCNPLGEFIRVQHRLARQTDTESILLELENRERELLGEFEAEWLGEIAGLVEWCSFRRGFVDEIALSAASFINHAEQLLTLAPIRVVHFSSVEDPERLAASPNLRRLRFADFSENPLANAGVRALAQSPHWQELRGLNLSGVGAANSGAQALARSTSLRQLQELFLSDNHIGDDGAYALARSQKLPRLQTLCLRFNGIGNGAANALRQRYGRHVAIS